MSNNSFNYLTEFIIDVGSQFRDSKLQNYITCTSFFRETRSDLQSHFQLIITDFINERKDSERGLEITGDSVIHHNELSIRWVDLECSVQIEITCVDTFVEIAIIKYHPHI